MSKGAGEQPGRRGTLTVVSTPLGNPEDLSPRAARALREADVIVAEDTRSARRLGAGAGKSPGTGDTAMARPATEVLSCFDANEGARAAEVAERLRAGENVVLVSEAGTPLVSDPGYRIVAAAVEVGARVVPVPGPSAALAALVGSGLPTSSFLFLGFPPRKPGARRRLFESLRPLPFTLVLYESPLRAAATLSALAETLGPQRRACLARELTKPHEEFVRGELRALAARYAEARPLGEVTLVVEGAPTEGEAPDVEALGEKAAQLLAQGLSPRDAARALADETGLPRREAYRLVTELNAGPLTRTLSPPGGERDS